MIRECSKCGGETRKAVETGNDVVSAETIYRLGYFTGSYTDKHFCLECGYIEEYVRNPKIFTDSKYEKMSIRERSDYKEPK